MSHLIGRLAEDLIVLAECHQEHDGSHILKTVNPLPPLWALASHIHHPAAKGKTKIILPIYRQLHSLVINSKNPPVLIMQLSMLASPTPGHLFTVCVLICNWQNITKRSMQHSPEHHILQVKRVLYNTCCGHPDPQDILLSWQVCSISDSVQVIQIAINTRRQSTVNKQCW